MMKRLHGLTVWVAVFCIVAMSAHVFAFTLLRFGGTDIKGLGVINHKECKSLTSILDQGSANANLPGNKGKGKTAEDGESATLIQRVNDNTMSRQADVSTILDLMKASNSEQVKGDNADVQGGDKTRTLVDAPLAVAPGGSAIAVSPPKDGEPPKAPEGYQLVSDEDATKIVEQVEQLKATEARLRLEAQQAQEDIQVLHRQRDAANAAAAAANAAAQGGATPGD
jgi:hypothetical protein